MKQVTLSNWYGRFGNNVCQLTNAIGYCLANNYSFLSPEHDLIRSFCIHSTKVTTLIPESNLFFNKFLLPYNQLRHSLIKKYILPNLKNIRILPSLPSSVVVIHIRGGDIFGPKIEKLYVQNPLNYFQNIIDQYDNAIIVSEDSRNPVISVLAQNNKVEIYPSRSLTQDIELILSAQNFCFSGFGSFGPICAMLSPNLKKIHATNIALSFIENMTWVFDNIDIEYKEINLDKYIKIGEWYNTPEQLKLMMNYV